jgi:hypothetical protein
MGVLTKISSLMSQIHMEICHSMEEAAQRLKESILVVQKVQKKVEDLNKRLE